MLRGASGPVEALGEIIHQELLMVRCVAVNEKGIRIGEHHHRSTIPDATVEEIRDMHEIKGKSYEQISRKLKLPYPTVAKICRYERRSQWPDKWKWVEVNG